MEVKSEWVPVASSAERLYDHFGNFANLSGVMSDKVQNFCATENECSFEVGGMAKVKLRMVDKIRPTHLALETVQGESPVPIKLLLDIEPQGETACKARVMVVADVPFVLSGMIKKPLEKFVDEMSQRLQQFTA